MEMEYKKLFAVEFVKVISVLYWLSSYSSNVFFWNFYSCDLINE